MQSLQCTFRGKNTNTEGSIIHAIYNRMAEDDALMIQYGCLVWLTCRPVLRQGCYMEIVQSRDRATLYSIIQQHTLPNTVVHTDEWATYG